MAKAKKLPSGNWNIQVFSHRDENGKQIIKSFTGATKAEAEFLAAQFKAEKKDLKKMKRRILQDITVSEACEKYIELSQILSPTTISGYKKAMSNSFPGLMDMKVSSLTDEIMQSAINLEARRKSQRTGRALSAKTIKNNYGFIASALSTVCKAHFDVKLPKVQPKNKILPKPEKVIEAYRGTEIELPCMLAMWLSFSMSEIRGIRCSSVKDGTISIDRVMVDVENKVVVKETGKVSTRIRKQSLPDYIMELIEQTDAWQHYIETGEDDYIVQLNSYAIKNRMNYINKRCGLDITFHDLRHIFASVMLTELQIPEKIVQQEGGWKTPHIMKSVYSNEFTDSRRKADEARDGYFNSLLR